MTDAERGRHVDTALIICALAIIMSLCTMQSVHEQRMSAKETRDVLAKTNSLLYQDLIDRKERRSTIDSRLDSIDLKLAASLAKITAQEDIISKIKESEDAYHTRRKPTAP